MKLDDSTEAPTNTQEKSIGRAELYALVWSTPLSTLAKQFSISDVGLGKVCKRYNIPRPGVGYWAQKRWGQTLKQEPLPPADDPELETITFWGSPSPSKDDEETPLVEDHELRARIEFERDPANAIRVQERYGKYHPLLSPPADQSKRNKADAVAPDGAFLRVGKNMKRRGRNLLNALFRAAEERGFRVGCSSSPRKGEATLTYADATLYFIIREPSNRLTIPKEKRKYSYQEYEFVPTGKLELRLGDMENSYCAKYWRDGKKKKLEDRLNEVLIECYVGVERQRKARLERERWDAEYRAKEQRRQLAILREKQEQQRIDHLLGLTAATFQAGQIRDLIDTIEARLASQGALEEDHRWREWLAWARDYADRTDPLSSICDTLARALELMDPPTEPAHGYWQAPRYPR